MVVRGVVEVFNMANRVNYSGVTERAFLVGTAVGGVTPLVFQDAAAVAAEGLNVRPFGAYTAAGTSGAASGRCRWGCGWSSRTPRVGRGRGYCRRGR